jgi:hypothetical protein
MDCASLWGTSTGALRPSSGSGSRDTGMYRMNDIVTVTSNNMGNPIHTVSASYPQTFNDVPICHLGIFKIDWTSALEVSISADAITASSLNININTQLTVTALSVRILVLDASLYSTPLFAHSYTLFAPPYSGLGQTILIENL